MPTETIIERVYTLIHRNRIEEARPLLTELFGANPNDAEAWALAAEIAPTEPTREEALRKVADLSTDNKLTEWAINELSLLKGLGAAGAHSEPPLPSVPDSWGGASSLETWSRQEASTPHREAIPLPPISPQAPPPPRQAPVAPEPARPVVTAKPLPEPGLGRPMGTPYLIRSIGGWVMMLGIVILIGAIISPPFNSLLMARGIPMGWIALAIIAVGGLVVGIGYSFKD